MEYSVTAHRIDAHGSLARSKNMEIVLDTETVSRRVALIPLSFFLTAIATYMIKSIERVSPTLNFDLRGVEVRLRAAHQDLPPKTISIHHELVVNTGESDERLTLLHTNVRKYGTVSNTVASAKRLEAIVRSSGWP